MRHDNKNGCKHQNEITMSGDIFILCKLCEPGIIRCSPYYTKETCKHYEK